jgi:hypothetical protein
MQAYFNNSKPEPLGATEKGNFGMFPKPPTNEMRDKSRATEFLRKVSE